MGVKTRKKLFYKHDENESNEDEVVDTILDQRVEGVVDQYLHHRQEDQDEDDEEWEEGELKKLVVC